MSLKKIAAVLSLLVAGPAMAVTCTGSQSLGDLGPPGTAWLSNSFRSSGNYLDCYSFSLTSAADSFGGVLEVDLFSRLDIDLTSVSLFSGSATSGALINTDGSPYSFSFASLAAGNYTLAVGSQVAKGSSWDDALKIAVGYGGYIKTVTAQLASAAPEPASYAMLLAGLVGIGAVVRRRKQGA